MIDHDKIFIIIISILSKLLFSSKYMICAGCKTFLAYPVTMIILACILLKV